MPTLRTEVVLERPLDEVFPFFADAANLEAITPPWVNFSILTPKPIEMRAGALIDYRIRVRGIPIRWRTRIAAWEPPHRFIDEQIRGPYLEWVHEHTFEPIELPGGRPATRCRDTVRYRSPLGFITHPLFVDRDVRRIFEYRRTVIQRLLAPHAADVRLSKPRP